jgi:hypothetical protein
MIELKEWWDVEYRILPEESIRYSKIVLITIKNHSPRIRKFKIGVENIHIKNKLNNLRIKMFLDVYQNPLVLEIDKYKKEEVGIAIPRLALPEDDAKIVFYVENEDTGERKTFEVFL